MSERNKEKKWSSNMFFIVPDNNLLKPYLSCYKIEQIFNVRDFFY